MPQLGETVAEGKITQWFKSAGDAIKPGDNLFEIETDKVSMEVPSTTAGVLAEIRVPAGAGGAGRRGGGRDRGHDGRGDERAAGCRGQGSTGAPEPVVDARGRHGIVRRERSRLRRRQPR